MAWWPIKMQIIFLKITPHWLDLHMYGFSHIRADNVVNQDNAIIFYVHKLKLLTLHGLINYVQRHLL